MNSFYNEAVKMDISKEYIPAIEMYKLSIEHEKVYMDAYINLAFLYWASSVKLNWSLKYNIPREIKIGGFEWAENLLNKANEIFKNCEIPFWALYFRRRLIGEDISEEEIVEIIDNRTYEKSLVPYFYLFLIDFKKYLHQRNLLLQECNKNQTAKNIYIKSIIDSNYQREIIKKAGGNNE